MASSRASVLANLQECQRNLATLQAQHTSTRNDLEDAKGRIRVIDAKTARSDREETILLKYVEIFATSTTTLEGLRVAIQAKESEEADLKRTLQTLPPDEDAVVVMFHCADPSPSTPSVSVLMARNVSKKDFDAKFFEKVPDIIAGTVSFVRADRLIANDDDVQSMMRDIKTGAIEVIYDTGRKAFSSWTEADVRAKGIWPADNPFLPDCGDVVLPDIALEQQTALREELERYANKLGRPKPYVSQAIFVLMSSGSSLLEAVRRVFINAFMLRVVECFKGVFLAMELSLVGSLGTGKLDYIIHYLRNWIVVTEAKKDDFSKGIAQNLIEMRSAAEDTRRKRKHWLPVYGIVSDGVTWVFLRLDNNGRKYSRSSNVIVVSYTAAPGDHTKTRVEGADVVFKYLYKIVAEQVNLLNEEEKQPGAKRQRLELDPDNAVVALTTEMEPFDSELL